MSRSIHDATAGTLGRVRRLAAALVDDPDSEVWSAAHRVPLREAGLALALAAGLPDEHRLLAELAAARAALAGGDLSAEKRARSLAHKFVAAAQQIAAELPDEICRAQRRYVAENPRTAP